jgi:Uma2 family endonuclease
MSEPAKKKANYDDLFNIPENMTGEIINGELVVTPRPSKGHALASSYLGGEVIPPYCHGRGGGPGGWVILDEPEIKFGENIIVPDLAGWRRERFPVNEEQNWVSVCPNWICEVLSHSTARMDRVQKMRIFAKHEVGHVWLLDPVLMTLEVFRLESGRWSLLDAFSENDKVRAEPFQEIEIDLNVLWLKGMAQATE